MNPLQLSPAQWRALLFLGTYSGSATRAGFRIEQLCKLAPAEPADLPALAAAGYIAGRHPDPARHAALTRQHVTGDEPTPAAVTAHSVKDRKLRIYLTAAGKATADLLYGAHQVLTHLRLSGPLPLPLLLHNAAPGYDVLARLERHGLIHFTPGEHLGWTEGFTAHVYRARESAATKEEHPCHRCGQTPPERTTVWQHVTKPGLVCCLRCIPDQAAIYGAPSELVSLTSLGRRYSDPRTVEGGA
ncbi:hypothetical protein ACWDA3_51225 [Nonomuraea rubra]